MTRLETLLSYAPNRVRDTWLNMGQQEVNDNIRIYTRNSVFRCTLGGAPLNGAIFFCDEDITVDVSFSWINYTLSNRATGAIMNENSIIHPNIHIVLTQAEFQAIWQDADNTFIPFQEIDNEVLLTIDEDALNMILIEAGVPFIALEELEYTRKQIVNYMIWPAVREYYKWFPIIEMGTYGLASEHFDITIPDPPVFTAVRAYLNPGYPISNVQGNPLARYFDEVLMSISPRGAFSTPNLNSSRRQGFVDTQSYATYILERAARQGIINYGSRTRIRIALQEGRVKGYTTKRGVLEIEWGKYSQDWSDIPFNRSTEVRDLAKAYVLRNFAMLRSQAKSDIPGTIDYSGFLTRADTLETKVLELWQMSTKSVAIRV